MNFTARSVHVAWDAQGFGPGVIQRRIDPSNAEETIGTSSTGDFEDTTAQPGIVQVWSVVTGNGPDYYRSDSARATGVVQEPR